jgi:exosome complex RNA-binding protein Rrp42 (RNase PH superfamily)
MLPFASSSSNERRHVRKEEMELTSTLKHLLLPHLISDEGKEQLVIVKGKYVWRLNIDLFVMHCDGNLMDVCSMAIWGAMQNLKLPNVVPIVADGDHDGSGSGNGSGSGSGNGSGPKGGKKASDDIMLDGDIANSIVPQGVTDCPIVITVCLLPKYVHETDINTKRNGNTGIVGSASSARFVSKHIDSVMVVDATRQEEACASTKVSISVDPKGNICGVHKYGSSSILLHNGSGNVSGNGNSTTAGGTIPLSTLSQVQNAAIAVSKSAFEMLRAESTSGGSMNCDTTLGTFNNFFRGHFELQ